MMSWLKGCAEPNCVHVVWKMSGYDPDWMPELTWMTTVRLVLAPAAMVPAPVTGEVVKDPWVLGANTNDGCIVKTANCAAAFPAFLRVTTIWSAPSPEAMGGDETETTLKSAFGCSTNGMLNCTGGTPDAVRISVRVLFMGWVLFSIPMVNAKEALCPTGNSPAACERDPLPTE